MYQAKVFITMVTQATAAEAHNIALGVKKRLFEAIIGRLSLMSVLQQCRHEMASASGPLVAGRMVFDLPGRRRPDCTG
jgi:hypothetical protein